jgi:hypothetical protein
MGEILERKGTGRALGHTEGVPATLITFDTSTHFLRIDDSLVWTGKNAHFAAYTTFLIHPNDTGWILCNGPCRTYVETGGLGTLLTYERAKGSSFLNGGNMYPGQREPGPVTLSETTSDFTPFTACASFRINDDLPNNASHHNCLSEKRVNGPSKERRYFERNSLFS